MSIWSLSKFDRSVCSCEFKVNFLIFLMFIPLGFWSRNYWNYLNHPLTANIWEKAILIWAENLNWGLSYLITTVIKTDQCAEVFKELTFFDIKYLIERKGKWNAKLHSTHCDRKWWQNSVKSVWKIPIRNESSIFMIFVLHH